MPELLAELDAAGALLAIATSKPDLVATDVLVHFELASWFRFVGGASLDGDRRTKADVIEHTLAAIDRATPAGRAGTVIVGDREHDIAGAKAAGIASIGVRWGFADPGELEAAGADAIAADVDELRDLLLVADATPNTRGASPSRPRGRPLAAGRADQRPVDDGDGWVSPP